MQNDLYQHSIILIRDNQHASGAYVASPNLAFYRYCWFRDGAFTAYAMDLIGERDSAWRFHNWVARTICAHTSVVDRALEKAGQYLPLNSDDVLHTRYHLDGRVGEGEWPNFQLDGFGTWLWALGEHKRIHGLMKLPQHWEQAIRLIVRYLAALWFLPNYDCWEEYGDRIHPYTLGAIYAGLRAAEILLDEDCAQGTLDAIREVVLSKGLGEGHLVKYFGSMDVDASLIGLATPYRLFDPMDPIMQNTVSKIENDLRSRNGGVHRYKTDTFYGGGEWVLLTAWLGWYYADCGQIDRARSLMTWVERQATPQGELPEQVPVNLNDPFYYKVWLKRWGPIARPLLWSHAMYLILHQAIQIRLMGDMEEKTKV